MRVGGQEIAIAVRTNLVLLGADGLLELEERERAGFRRFVCRAGEQSEHDDRRGRKCDRRSPAATGRRLRRRLQRRRLAERDEVREELIRAVHTGGQFAPQAEADLADVSNTVRSGSSCSRCWS